jgi:hypothetical protein
VDANLVTAAETAELIRHSDGRVLPLRFGPRWAALVTEETPQDHWAYQTLCQIRGNGVAS